MNNYSNPMVTYNEIIEALKAILDCSKTNGYLDEYNFLNARYDVLNKNPLYEEQEQALIQAIQSLEKTIDAADKVIRENLQNVLNEIVTSSSFIVPTRYKKDEEYRKLAAQDEFVAKLKEMSLPLEVLSQVTVPEAVVEEPLDEIENLVAPFEEVEIEALDIPSLDDEPEEDVYYSKVKLGNVKNAFAVTEEQYQKLQQYNSKDEESFEGLAELEAEASVLKEESEDKEVVTDDEFTISEIPTEIVSAEGLTTEDLPINEEKEETPKEVEVPEEKGEELPEKEEEKETISLEQKKASLDRIKLIKKALDKAKEKENTQLVQILEQQLRKEVAALKS